MVFPIRMNFGVRDYKLLLVFFFGFHDNNIYHSLFELSDCLYYLSIS